MTEDVKYPMPYVIKAMGAEFYSQWCLCFPVYLNELDVVVAGAGRERWVFKKLGILVDCRVDRAYKIHFEVRDIEDNNGDIQDSTGDSGRVNNTISSDRHWERSDCR